MESKIVVAESKFESYFMAFHFIIYYAGAWIIFTSLFFNYLLELSLDYMFFSFFGISTILCGIFWGKIFSKVQNPLFFSILNIPVGVCCLVFWLLNSTVLFIINCLIFGFLAVSIFMGSQYYLKTVFPIYKRGKTFGLFMFIYAIIVICFTFIVILFPARFFFLFFGIIFLITGSLGFFLWKKSPIQLVKTEKKESIFETSIDRKDSIYYLIAIFIFTFILGIAIWQVSTSPTIHQLIMDAGALIIGDLAYTASGVESVTLFAMSGVLVISIPAGVLMDRIGRKELWISSLIFLGLGLSLFGLIVAPEICILTFIIGGIGIGIFLNCIVVTFIDLPDAQSRLYIGRSWSIYFLGIMSGIGFSMMTIMIDPTYISLIIMFTCFIAIFSVLHAKETLPSKEEREWRDCIQYLLLIHMDGICLIHHPFIEIELGDQDLIAGGLTGIISLVQEMTKSKERIEILSQKDFKMLLNYGKYTTAVILSTKDLKILHTKLDQFIFEFEDLFQEFLTDWTGSISIFKPAERLIIRFFK
ncbi:MAG: hypothetical protein HWN66_18130 [Candidatus Helarchaeota archaeon]|nr:hypothetical protein [Candidatus Helarchaeota archaeon]